MAASRTCRSARLLALLLLSGCLPEITLPVCEVLTDCPVCEGWTQCRDGFCFKFDGTPGWDRFECGEICLESDHVASDDGCCPGRSAAADGDPDCLAAVVEIPNAEWISRAAVLSERVVVVRADAAGALSVVRLSSGGVEGEVALPTSSARPAIERPVLLPNGDALVASATGHCRTDEEGVVWPCNRGEPPTLAPVVASDDRIAGVAADRLQIIDGAGVLIDDATLDGEILGVAATDARWYVTTAHGVLYAFELDGALDTPGWIDSELSPATPPSIDGDATVLFGDQSGRVVGVIDTGAASSLRAQDLAGAVGSQITTNGEGRGCAVATDGTISLLEVGAQLSRTTVAGDTAGVTSPGVWTTSGRLFLTAPGRVLGYAPAASQTKQLFAWHRDDLAGVPANVTSDHQLVLIARSSVVFLATGAGRASTGWATPDHPRTR